MEAKQFRKRSAILACLRASHAHPSAEALYAQLKPDYPDISLGTVYRNLALFKREGIIASVGTVDGVERFDGDTRPHTHFICTHCGMISDLPGLPLPAEFSADAERRCGGRVESCRLSFAGICEKCLSVEREGGENA